MNGTTAIIRILQVLTLTLETARSHISGISNLFPVKQQYKKHQNAVQNTSKDRGSVTESKSLYNINMLLHLQTKKKINCVINSYHHTPKHYSHTPFASRHVDI